MPPLLGKSTYPACSDFRSHLLATILALPEPHVLGGLALAVLIEKCDLLIDTGHDLLATLRDAVEGPGFLVGGKYQGHGASSY
jgi:hypothetical protein